MSTWGVWCRRGDDPDFGWFRHSDGTPIHYQSESEARSVASGLRLLLPQNEYEAQPMPVTDEELFRDALRSVPTMPPTLLYTLSVTLVAASKYIRVLEEEMGHQGVSPPDSEELRKTWVEAQVKVTEACQEHLAAKATRTEDPLVVAIAKEYIDALEAIPGTDLYLRTGASPDSPYPQAALCVAKRKAWLEVEP